MTVINHALVQYANMTSRQGLDNTVTQGYENPEPRCRTPSLTSCGQLISCLLSLDGAVLGMTARDLGVAPSATAAECTSGSIHVVPPAIVTTVSFVLGIPKDPVLPTTAVVTCRQIDTSGITHAVLGCSHAVRAKPSTASEAVVERILGATHGFFFL
jgi:hypothetical protein